MPPDSSAQSQRHGKGVQQSPGPSPPPSCILGFEVLLLGAHTPWAWITTWLRPVNSTERGCSSPDPSVHAKPQFVLFPPSLSRGRCKWVLRTLLTTPGWAGTVLNAASSSLPGPAWPLPARCQALRVSLGTVPPSALPGAAHSPGPCELPAAGHGTLRARTSPAKPICYKP